MKKIAKLFFFILFLLSSCGEPPTKIYPKNGMFPDMTKTYELNCYIEWGKERDRVNYRMNFNSKFKAAEFSQEDWDPFKKVKIVENNETVFAISINDDDSTVYSLFRDNGSFGVDAWNNGYCIENGYKWVLNKSENTVIYKKIN